MDEKLIARLESAVSRLEVLSSGFGSGGANGIGGETASDPAIVAFDDLVGQYLGRVSSAAEKIGGQVLEVTKTVQEAFIAQKELLIKAKQTQKPDLAGLAEFLKPLHEAIMKANALTEGRRSDYFNHLKSAADSLSALGWIAYTGKDCGMSMPIAHVEESWQMAEFYNNKVLVEYKNKDPNHVEWAKAMKELYLPGLRDYVKSNYPLGPVWSPTGKPAAAPPKAPTPGAPAPPPPPPASLFSSESSQASSSRPKEGMAAVFQEISSGKPVTTGLRKVTDDMKTKNRADRTGVVGVSEKEGRTSSRSFSKAGPPKLELQMGRKWVVENQIGKKQLVIDDCDAKQSVYVYLLHKMSLSKYLSVFFFLFITLCFSLAHAARFDITNNCPFTVWAGAKPGGGRQLNQGQTWNLDVNAGTTQARIWARTGCNFDGSGRGSCQTGDCGGLLQCQGYGAAPNTLAEFALNQPNNLDYFDISLVDGFNVPMEFSPTSNGCTRSRRCTADINGQCPSQLKAPGGCNNPCTVFKTDQYCCNSGNCAPTDFSRFFKDRCPDAYSYPKDDPTSLVTCPGGTNYKVVFCP